MVHAAGLPLRSIAFALDSVVVVLVSLAVCSSLGLVDWLAWPDVRWNLLDLTVDIVNAQLPNLRHLALTTAVVGLLYGTLTEAVVGATPAKRLLGLRVICRYGRRPSLPLLVLRNIVKVVTTAALGLGPLWSFVDPQRRALHDLASTTRVVRAGVIPRLLPTLRAGG